MTLSDPARDPSSPSSHALRSSAPTPFVVLLRFEARRAEGSVPDGEVGRRERLAQVLQTLSGCSGFQGGWVGRTADAVDDGSSDQWVLVVHWRSVGEYRRALSSVDVRLAVLPVLSEAMDGPSAYEVLHGQGTDGTSDAPWGATGPSSSARATT